MSTADVDPTPQPVVPGSSTRGQSMVEFALVLPMLLVLLLGVADFGRVFAAGITVEAAARNAAEAAAQEYLQLVRNKPGGVLATADYAHLHDVALDAACNEARTLPNRAEGGGLCSMPATAVCIHDGADPYCGSEADTSLTECSELNQAWSNANLAPAAGGRPPLPHVEVVVCYRFTTLVNLENLSLPFGWGLSVGAIHLEKNRSFTVADY